MGDESKKGLTVLVCGGGNAAQVATSMFASRYETYAISLYADEAAKWKKHMMGGRWHDKVEGMEPDFGYREEVDFNTHRYFQ